MEVSFLKEILGSLVYRFILYQDFSFYPTRFLAVIEFIFHDGYF